MNNEVKRSGGSEPKTHVPTYNHQNKPCGKYLDPSCYTFDNPLRHFDLDGDDINLDIGSMVSSMTYVELDDVCPTRVERDGKEFAHLQRIYRYPLRWAFVANNDRKPKQNLVSQIQFNTGQAPSKKVDQTVSHGTIQEAIVRFNDLQDVSFEVKHKEIPNDRRS